jgi:cell division transport system permease protein
MSTERSPWRFALFTREAWRNIRAAPSLTFVAVLTIGVSLLLVGLFGFVVSNGDELLDNVGRDLQLTVYLNPDIDEVRLDALVSALSERPEVETITVLSAEEDKQRTLDLLSPDLLEGLDESALPYQPAIDVRLEPRKRSKGDFDAIATWLKGFEGADGVQELHFGADKIRILFAIMDLIRVTGLFICLIVLAAAVFFILSIIKLAVYARQEEIEILRLVGATDAFIRAPFYIEGLVAGFLGSITALTIVYILHSRLMAFIEEEHALNVHLDLMPAWMITWILLGGILLGLLGSALSVRRYLKA